MAILPNSALSRYVSMANSFPKLSRERKTQLWYKWRYGFDARGLHGCRLSD
jgi:hypothetical protein